MKTDIVTVPDSLAKVDQLHGVYFPWRDPKLAGNQVGLIAQDVEKTFPDLVHVGWKGYKTVNYIGLIGPIINAVKELYAE